MVTATATNTRTPAEVYASLNTNSNYAEQASGKATEQQTRFLKLLTAQLKNQDPTAPMDNAQMTSQLAQISTVDGVERLNLTLQKLVNGARAFRPQCYWARACWFRGQPPRWPQARRWEASIWRPAQKR